MRLEVFPTAADAAAAAAELLAERAREAIEQRGRFEFAASGGTSPWLMYEGFAAAPGIEWEHVHVWQVDERIVPTGDDARNLTHLRRVLPDLATVHEMPVGSSSATLEEAAAAYAATLPARFDAVHLGLGVDGHAASLVPGDPVLEVRDRDVAITRPYQGARRMTLTYPVLARAELTLFLVTGADKRGPLSQLLAGDLTIPASHVPTADGVVFADADAAPD